MSVFLLYADAIFVFDFFHDERAFDRSDIVVAADNLYGGTYNLITHTLATQGISSTIVNVNDLAALEAAIRPETKVIYAETFGNPNGDVLDVDGVKSLVIHPYTTTHSQLSEEELAQQHITPATVRLSIGTEHIDDILDDLAQALDKI